MKVWYFIGAIVLASVGVIGVTWAVAKRGEEQ